MPFSPGLVLKTVIVLTAFAGNSLLCRLALKQTQIDATSFTAVRIVSGALFLLVLLRVHRPGVRWSGSWASAIALWVYAAAFSYAYLGLSAATGALILFGSVQVVMIGIGWLRGERLGAVQWAGLAVALAGLVYLLLPGVSAPPAVSAFLMMLSGAAWGVYSLRAKGVQDPLAATAGNFLRAIAPALLLSGVMLPGTSLDVAGVMTAAVSGAITSGAGYALWYAVAPRLGATRAAVVQLCVPMLAAFGGVLVLNEHLTLRLGLASIAVIGGVAIVTLRGVARR